MAVGVKTVFLCAPLIFTDVLEEPATSILKVEGETEHGKKRYGYRDVEDRALVLGRTNVSQSH
jgi:hypothetical protein